MTSSTNPVSRRALLAAGGSLASLAAIGGWTPAFQIPASAAPMALPPGLPPGVIPYVQAYRNWSGEIATDPVWTCSVAGPSQVVDLANWAHAQGWKLRARGYRHTWAPITLGGDEDSASKLLLVDTRSGLTGISISRTSPASVSVGTGVSLETLLTMLNLAGYGIVNHPAPGEITVGGALTIDGHGTSIPFSGERLKSGHTFGSMSNLILDLDAVVWDDTRQQYVLKTFQRNETAIAPLLTHVGRAFITRVRLRVGPSMKLRCQSYTSIPATELLAAPGSGGRTVASFLDKSGRMEIIWFPFTVHPWFKVWTPAALPPLGSVPVLTPYPYTFADLPPALIGDMAAAIVKGNPSQAKSFGPLQLTTVQGGLVSTLTSNIWGSGKDTMLYVRPTTLRVTANGYAVLCRRSDLQKHLHAVGQLYADKLASHAAAGKYPINGPLEIRVTGLDDPAHCGVSGAVEPWLSAVRRRPDHPEWDCAIWFDILSLPGTPDLNEFMTEIEQWMYATFDGSDSAVRVEWSKGWGYTTDAGAWTSSDVISGKIPHSLTVGQPAGTQFADAVAGLNALDPHRIYSSPLLDRVLP